MGTFLLGMLVGGIVVVLAGIFGLALKIYNLVRGVDGVVRGLHGMATVSAMQIARIEKTSQATMVASENFVDAIRQSADMYMRGPGMAGPFRPPVDNFNDLRETFEDGIKRFEDEMDEDEDDEQKPWDKKK